MSAMTNYLEGALIDHLFRATQYSHSSPAEWHVGLLTAAHGEDGSGGTELSGNNYVRVAVTRGTSTWTKEVVGNDYSVKNTSTVTFNAPSGPWGVVTHIGIWDVTTGGTLILEAALQYSKNINQGDPAPKFNAGDLKFTFN